MPWLSTMLPVMPVEHMAWLGSIWGKFQVPHYNTAFSVTNPDTPSLRGLDITRVKLIFSFKHHNKTYPCAPIHWFLKINKEPDINTRMWWVEPDFNAE